MLFVGDLLFDRAVAIGSGFLGTALLAAATMHLREPLSGSPSTPIARVADVPAIVTPVSAESPMATAAAVAPAADRPRIHIVAWPSEAPVAAKPRYSGVERRSTPIAPGSIPGYPASLRIERKATAPQTRIASRPTIRVAEPQMKQLPPLPMRLISTKHVATIARRPAEHPVATRSAAVMRPVTFIAAKPKTRFVADAAPRAVTPPVRLTEAVLTGSGTSNVVALRPRTSPTNPVRVRHRAAADAVPEPPVGYNPNAQLVPSDIGITTASAIAADADSTNGPVVILLKRGR